MIKVILSAIYWYVTIVEIVWLGFHHKHIWTVLNYLTIYSYLDRVVYIDTGYETSSTEDKMS